MTPGLTQLIIVGFLYLLPLVALVLLVRWLLKRATGPPETPASRVSPRQRYSTGVTRKAGSRGRSILR